MRIAIALVLIIAAGLTAWITVETRRNRMVWDHFDVVKHGILYRSGQLTSEQLEAAIKRYGIRTVVNFQIPGARVNAEGAEARCLGVDYLNLPMPGDGFGRESQFREVLEACDDPHRRPVLVHCARGTCRTGAAVALYRFERDGWTIEDVSAEMRRQVYRGGWLAGYVYGMAKAKPAADLFEPAVRYDKNLPPPPPVPAPEPPLRSESALLLEEASHVR
ncbi:MAG: tyrosine-protein phosphatase [Isosphaeraceae bacterium]|nr:tyrosine-protein phosphatase [Isosphaeraceae bacterium]